mmetsp:Transcript_21008/g.30328  ORF Transcript_21008/g.30328 Transcript_21008/m.30328 type:complete len:88 (-) Transcript_21008:10-273(-)
MGTVAFSVGHSFVLIPLVLCNSVMIMRAMVIFLINRTFSGNMEKMFEPYRKENEKEDKYLVRNSLEQYRVVECVCLELIVGNVINYC